MKIRYWGVRGSVPVPGKETLIYGGNTACVSVETGDAFLIFDAGTGVRECGNFLLSRGGSLKATFFISHTHWDHIQGFPFFVPAYLPGNSFDLYGPPSEIQDLPLKKIMALQASYEYFPVHQDQLAADIRYFDCRAAPFQVEGVEVQTCRLNHPVTSLAYKITHQGKTFVYGGDHEPFSNIYRNADQADDLDEEMLAELDDVAAEQNERIVGFCQGADLVSWDGQYSDDDYLTHKGWGHSYYSADLDLAKRAAIKHICLTHHDPAASDEKLTVAERELKAAAAEQGFELHLAKEGMDITL